VTKADDYRKRAAKITKTGKWRTSSGDRVGMGKTIKALSDMADNEDWLAGKTKPKTPRSNI
jgi:hypothetical protein